MLRIKKLKVKYFRGIVENNLEFNEKSVILFGENGQGKSSFVDALEFLFKGKVTYLDEVQTTSTSRHAPHISSGEKSCEVEIEFQDGSKITRSLKQGLSQVPTHIQSFFQSGGETQFILRRKYLLDFILAQPAPRYERLASLIRISDVENVELSLMRKRDQLKEEVEKIKYNLNDIQEQTKKMLGEEFKSEEQLLAILNEKLKSLGQLPLTSFDDIAKRKEDTISLSDEVNKALEVSKSIETVEQINSRISNFGKHEAFWKKVSAFQRDKEKLKELMFKQLLEQGQRLIMQIDWDKCPLCLQPIEKSEILSSIEKRLSSFKQIIEQETEIINLRIGLQEDLAEITNNVKILVNVLKKLDYKNDFVVFDNLNKKMRELNDNISREPADIEITPFDEIRKKIFNKEIEKLLMDCSEWLKNEQQKLTPTERDKVTVQIIDLLTKSSEIKEKFTELSEKFKIKDQIAKQMDTIYRCFIETKHVEVQKIYDSLQNDISRYYQVLHPEEENRDIKLMVIPERRGSAEIRSTFYDRRDEDPRGFNSEAHLDSLGLCIFLAFTKHFNKNFPLIVLDDVIFSIDATHRNRVSDLIYKEFVDYQFLITTHDCVWFEELCSAQRAFSVENKFINLKIIRWSLEEGPIIDKYRPKWDEIQKKIDEGDRKGAAMEGRTFLEWFCKEMLVRLQIPIVLKPDNRYKISDLYSPFKEGLKNILPEFYDKDAFQQLEKNMFFGNILSHDDPKADSITMNEVKDFVDSLKRIFDLFLCSECSSLVKYIKGQKVIKCICSKKQWNTK